MMVDLITNEFEKLNLNKTFDELKIYYDETLNKDKSTYKSTNDEPTPIDCVIEMCNKIPDELFKRNNLKILDCCCGNGNFHLVIRDRLKKENNFSEENLEFIDINNDRLKNVKEIFGDKVIIQNTDYLKYETDKKYDLIVANPPYAKLLENGKRASKNHNLIKDFISKSLSLLKEEGYLMFITPDNWMSYADRNILIKELTKLQIIHLDIHSAKKYFKKIGSSFTWYIIQNKPYYKDISISGIWKGKVYSDFVKSAERKYIPLFYNSIIQKILLKTIDNDKPKYKVETSSDLHKYTKKSLISSTETGEYKYKLIHTPTQTVYSSRPHKYQEGYKVFISTTNLYSLFIDNCGMTQSIAFIRCKNENEANEIKQILEKPVYKFINNICRYGNFNNIRILQNFPVDKSFKLTKNEEKFISDNI